MQRFLSFRPARSALITRSVRRTSFQAIPPRSLPSFPIPNSFRRNFAFKSLHQESNSSAPGASAVSEQETRKDGGEKKKWGKGSKTLIFTSGVGLVFTAAMASQLEENSSWLVAFFKTIPARLLSRLWGDVNHLQLPMWAREPVYHLWTYLFDCKLEEVQRPLTEYENLAAFFSRSLKDGVRPMSESILVSPVDAKVSVFGKLDPVNGYRIDQVKGMSYSLSSFLGESVSKLLPPLPPSPSSLNPASSVSASPQPSLHYIVLYLAPGDYHRIHTPCDMSVDVRHHFAGEMFPISPLFAKVCPSLFTRNERVIVAGAWKHGFMSVSPVAAYNVGNMTLTFDNEMVTNKCWQSMTHSPEQINAYGQGTGSYVKHFKGSVNQKVGKALENVNEMSLKLGKGDEFGAFRLGSTVVLVFETKDADYQFSVKEGDKVKVGQSLGYVVK